MLMKITGAFVLVLQVALFYLTLQEMTEYAYLAYAFFLPTIFYVLYTLFNK